MKERYIDAETLSRRICCYGTDEGDNLLLLDCRSATSYRNGHIKGAVNTNCPPILLRRLQKGERPRSFPPCTGEMPVLKKIISTCTFSYNCINGKIKAAVLYDDRPTQSCGNHISFSAEIMASILTSEITNVFILKEGYRAFQLAHPHLCRTAKPLSASQGCLPLASLSSKKQPDISKMAATKVLPYLYLGNQSDSTCPIFLRKCGITHVLNVASESTQTWVNKGIVYKNIPMKDVVSENLLKWLEECFEFIETARQQGGCVLVHCMAGISRSAAVTLAYVMRAQGIGLDCAYRQLKALRSSISPNLGFMGQLQQFEQAEAQRVQQTSHRVGAAQDDWPTQTCMSGVSPLRCVQPSTP